MRLNFSGGVTFPGNNGINLGPGGDDALDPDINCDRLGTCYDGKKKNIWKKKLVKWQRDESFFFF